MTDEAQLRRRRRKQLWLALALLAVTLIVLLVPPLVSIGRYKSRITSLMSASLGRPVRLSSVELRLLPRPAFVLSDLSVKEDPTYGAEPVFHAGTVTADIRLLSLWRGRLEISRMSADEASMNLVRAGAGRWNLDSLFRTAAGQSTAAGRAMQLPYLEATNSRINIKNGLEKLPFSLVNADISMWQEEPGDWRVRLRGQPARTDVSLDFADTGVVRLEGSLRRAPQLHEMPLHFDLVWREAQLGQLSRLVIGSDPGWRGDLTGELHLDGTADTAQVTTRLRASGVHRAEFAPAEPLDFDANCTFVVHYSGRVLQNVACDSPLGDGHIRLAGELEGDGQPRFSIELQRIAAQAGLDVLRTVRSDIGEGLAAQGTVSGKLNYSAGTGARVALSANPRRQPVTSRSAKSHPVELGPLTGSLTVEGFRLSGESLSQPIQIAKIVLEPAPPIQGELQALATVVAVPAGGPSPLAITARLAASGYQVTVRGQASLVRLRELAHTAGVTEITTLDALAGEPVVLDLNAAGPWMPGPQVSFSRNVAAAAEPGPGTQPITENVTQDRLTGTVTLHSANWKSDYLANHIEISQATLHLEAGGLRWDPVVFSYGPLKGTATINWPSGCTTPEPCPPQVQAQFVTLDAAALQAALLGAHEPGTMLSALIARLRPSTPQPWPRLDCRLEADSLALGPVALQNAVATLRVLPTGAEITSFDAAVLGGLLHASGEVTSADKPSYALQGEFKKVSSPAVCSLLGLSCAGGPFDANGKINLSGFTGQDLAASAKGNLHFEWRHGTVRGRTSPASLPLPPPLARFERWTGDAVIASGAVTLSQNQIEQGARKSAVTASVTLSDPPKVSLAMPRKASLSKR